MQAMVRRLQCLREYFMIEGDIIVTGSPPGLFSNPIHVRFKKVFKYSGPL